MNIRFQLILRLALTTLLVGLWLTAAQGCGKTESQENHDAQGVAADEQAPSDEAAEAAEGHEHADATADPTTYAEAYHFIHERMESIEDAFSENRLADIHEQAEEIATVAGAVGTLSLAQNSGVPRESVKTVNLASKELVSVCDELHDASDVGERQAAEKAYGRMVELVKTLSEYAEAEADHD